MFLGAGISPTGVELSWKFNPSFPPLLSAIMINDTSFAD
jgi:hypothetical protein